MTTPTEQIAEFVRRHPGEWCKSFPPNGIDGGPGQLLSLRGSQLWVYPGREGVEFAIVARGIYAFVTPADLVLRRLAEHEAWHITERGGAVSSLPAWLRDETSRVLRHRAGELWTAAGFSERDAVVAAETLDEALCTRAPVEPTFDAVVNALQGIGMSCRWVKTP